MLNLSQLLEKKLHLHSRKYALVSKIFYQKSSYFAVYRAMNQLRIVILKEIALNKRISRKIARIEKKSEGRMRRFMDALAVAMHELTSILYEELVLLSELGLFNILMFNIEVLLFKDSKRGFFAKRCSGFMKALKEEHETSKKIIRLIRLSGLEIEGFQREKQRFYAAKRMIKQLHEANKALIHSIGNINLVKKRAGETLELIEKLQKTDLYEFVKEDVDIFKKKVIYAMKHPKDHKFAYALASAYIVAPGTFEITFLILFAKYMTKYALKTVKKISG